MKNIYHKLNFIITSAIFSFVFCFIIACGNNNEITPNTHENIDGLIQLHEAMNTKHGKTQSYYANLAIADGDYDKAYSLRYQECKQGSVIECLNAYYAGEERALPAYDSVVFARQLAKSIRQSLYACKQNVSFGCVNVFFAFEALDDDDDFIKNIIETTLKGHNDEMIADKALKLTKKECENNDAASCFFYARISRIIDNYADVKYYINKGLDLGYVLAPFVQLPIQSPQTLDYFKRSCSLNEALSCRYIGYWYEKYVNDKKNARVFYQKACKLGIASSCDNARKPLQVQVDEVGSPVLNR